MNRSPTHPRSAPLARFVSRGVSLIELMVAMAIGLLIVATIGNAYLGAKASFRTQDALSLVQENARYTFEFMGEDIRMAGFSGGPTDGVVTQPAAWTGERDLQNFPLRGYEAGVSTFPTAITAPATRPRLRGDALTVVHVDTDNEYALDAAVTPNPSATAFTLSAWPSSAPQVGGIFVGADYTGAAAFHVTDLDSGAKTITTDDSLGAFTGAVAARRVFPLKGATYYIAENTVGEPALYRLRLTGTGTTIAEELVEGVRDMQITYGVDYSAPALATAITGATWASGAIIFTSPAHGLVTGDWVTISGVSPAAFDGFYRVTSFDTDTFRVVQATTPGSYVSGGLAQKAADNSVDAYWTADEVNAGTDLTNTIPGPATASNYWAHVLSVRVTLTLTTRQSERVSTTGNVYTKSFTTTFAVRNRL